MARLQVQLDAHNVQRVNIVLLEISRHLLSVLQVTTRTLELKTANSALLATSAQEEGYSLAPREPTACLGRHRAHHAPLAIRALMHQLHLSLAQWERRLGPRLLAARATLDTTRTLQGQPTACHVPKATHVVTPPWTLSPAQQALRHRRHKRHVPSVLMATSHLTSALRPVIPVPPARSAWQRGRRSTARKVYSQHSDPRTVQPVLQDRYQT